MREIDHRPLSESLGLEVVEVLKERLGIHPAIVYKNPRNEDSVGIEGLRHDRRGENFESQSKGLTLEFHEDDEGLERKAEAMNHMIEQGVDGTRYHKAGEDGLVANLEDGRFLVVRDYLFGKRLGSRLESTMLSGAMTMLSEIHTALASFDYEGMPELPSLRDLPDAVSRILIERELDLPEEDIAVLEQYAMTLNDRTEAVIKAMKGSFYLAPGLGNFTGESLVDLPKERGLALITTGIIQAPLAYDFLTALDPLEEVVSGHMPEEIKDVVGLDLSARTEEGRWRTAAAAYVNGKKGDRFEQLRQGVGPVLEYIELSRLMTHILKGEGKGFKKGVYGAIARVDNLPYVNEKMDVVMSDLAMHLD